MCENMKCTILQSTVLRVLLVLNENRLLKVCLPLGLHLSRRGGGHLEHAVTHTDVTFEAELRAHIQPKNWCV